MIRQNEAFDVSFSKKLVKVIRGHPRSRIAEKGQISNFIKSIQNICKNEAFGVSFKKMILSGSFKVTQGYYF